LHVSISKKIERRFLKNDIRENSILYKHIRPKIVFHITSTNQPYYIKQMAMMKGPTLLCDLNAHIRDKFIKFYEKGHVYYVKREKGYKSVTTLVHDAFEKFNANKVIDNMMASPNWENSKYFGMTKEDIKEQWKKNGCDAAKMGTAMHAMFEYYYNNIREDVIQSYEGTKEHEYFMNFIRDHPELKPYRTEWNVYHEDYRIAGSIDMIFQNEDGTLSIYDWKRCKNIERYNGFGKKCLIEGLAHISDTNYWHYTFQLNIYKYILETKYGFQIKDLHLVVIHPENVCDNYEKIKLPFIQKDVKILLDHHLQREMDKKTQGHK
jgi:hypothetical protein